MDPTFRRCHLDQMFQTQKLFLNISCSPHFWRKSVIIQEFLVYIYTCSLHIKKTFSLHGGAEMDLKANWNTHFLFSVVKFVFANSSFTEKIWICREDHFWKKNPLVYTSLERALGWYLNFRCWISYVSIFLPLRSFVWREKQRKQEDSSGESLLLTWAFSAAAQTQILQANPDQQFSVLSALISVNQELRNLVLALWWLAITCGIDHNNDSTFVQQSCQKPALGSATQPCGCLAMLDFLHRLIIHSLTAAASAR